MYSKARLILCFLALICFIDNVVAQNFLGTSFGDYNTYYSMFVNPASLAGCKEKITLHAFSFDAINDDNCSFLAPKTKYRTIDGQQTIYETTYPSNSNVNGLKSTQAFLPGILVRIDMNNTIALTTRVRNVIQYDNVKSDFINSLSGVPTNSNIKFNLADDKFNAYLHVWSEIGLSYGFNAMSRYNQQLKIGASIKYLSGGYYSTISGHHLEADYDSGDSSYNISKSKLLFSTNILQRSENEYINFGMGSESPTKGWATDIGIVYSYIFNADGDNSFDVTDYKAPSGNRLRLSLSITDLGKIAYSKCLNYTARISGSSKINYSDLANGIQSYDDIRKLANITTLNFDTSKIIGGVSLGLPTAVNASIDYQIDKGHPFYLNVFLMRPLTILNRNSTNTFQQISFTPHYDSRRITVGLPISYNSFSNELKLGLGMTLAAYGHVLQIPCNHSITLGVTDLQVFFNKKQHGYGFYMGYSINLYEDEHW